MRNGLKVLVAVAVAASVAACEPANDDVEVFEGEEAATPSVEGMEGTEAPLFTAQFEPAEGATESARISGTVRIFPENARTDAARTTPTTDARATETETDAELSATTTDGAEAGQGFRVEVALTGLSEGEHAWHIHAGPCDEQAPVEVAFTSTASEEGLANALNAGEDGRAEGSATVPSDELTLDRLQSGEYSIIVHAQGGEDHGPAIACADLNGQGGARP